DVPGEITPEYIRRQRLLLLTEQPPSAGHTTVMGWVPEGTPSLAVGTVEALKSAVASNVGMAILPEVAVTANTPNIILRPLRPPTIARPLPATAALLQTAKQAKGAGVRVRPHPLPQRAEKKTPKGPPPPIDSSEHSRIGVPTKPAPRSVEFSCATLLWGRCE